MLTELTAKIVAGENITFDEAQTALNAILDGDCSDVAIAGFLTALATKGETAEEIAGMARALRDHAVPVRPRSKPLIDVVGTGGDGQSTFNISTTAALVVAGTGAAVAKHGNRAITSKCGSADLLAELGVKIDAPPEKIERCIDEAHIGFMFAPCHHPTMKYVQPIRKALGFRTAFNILGPLANPAAVPLQMIGVATPQLLTVMAEALKHLGVKRAMIVHGQGIDEATTCGPTDMVELNEGQITRHVLDYSDYDFPRASISDFTSSSLADNAALTSGILDNKVTGPCRDIVEFNAAIAIMLTGKATGIMEGIELARQSINRGDARKALEGMIEISNS